MPNPRLKPPLLPNPRLKPLLMLTTDIIAVDTTDMADTAVDTVMVVTISAKGLLMLNPRLMPLLMLTTDTTAVDTDTDADTVMAVVTTVMADTVVDTDMVDTA